MNAYIETKPEKSARANNEHYICEINKTNEKKNRLRKIEKKNRKRKFIRNYILGFFFKYC